MDDKAAEHTRRKTQLFEAALTLLLERAGRSLTFTEAEYQAVVNKYGGPAMMTIHYEAGRGADRSPGSSWSASRLRMRSSRARWKLGGSTTDGSGKHGPDDPDRDRYGAGRRVNVTILSSAFAHSGAHGGTSIPAANFAVTEARAPTLASGQEIDPVGGPRVPPSGATGDLDAARKTLQAGVGLGGGTYTQELGVSLVVPANSRAGSYTAMLTVTASTGP